MHWKIRGGDKQAENYVNFFFYDATFYCAIVEVWM